MPGTFAISCLATIYACMVLAAVTAERGPLQRFLTWPLLQAFGKYSYAMYIVQMVFFIRLRMVLGDPANQGPSVQALKTLSLPLSVAFTFGAALISGHILEMPFNRLKHRFQYGAPNDRPLRQVRAGAASAGAGGS